MSKSDVEMEDPRELPNDLGNKVQESENKVLDSKIENEAEISPPADAALGDVNIKVNGSDDLDSCNTEVKDNTEVKIGVSDQINPKSEADKPIEESASGEINSKSDNEEQINTETKAEEHIGPISAVEKQIDGEVVEQKATDGGLEENKPSENGVAGEKYQENVEKIPNEDVADMKAKEIVAENADAGDKPKENKQLPTNLSATEDLQSKDAQSDEFPQGKDEETADAVDFDEDKDKEQNVGTVLASCETFENDRTAKIAAKQEGEESSLANQQVAKTELLSRCSSEKAVDNNEEMAIAVFTQPTLHLIGEGDDGTPEEQMAFMKDLESFYRERAMDFKPPKFYGQPLNCLKLWRSVIRLGGYDRVTGSKLWRQVGESFHPPKTCTTVSWTFRIFYEKSILEFERHKTQSGELQLPTPMLPEVSGIDGEGNGYQGSGAGRARRDSASRAMQGWHAQRLSDSGEVSNMGKHEKNIKSIGSLKQKRPHELEHSSKAARTELSKQLTSSVVDIGPPADWVKINVRQTKDCFEVYALVPGLLREEVRVQSDPAGRVVITGQPEQADNPWGITAFKKVVSLPSRIDPLQTSAVVSLHGRLLVRVPYEQSNVSN